MTTTVRYIVFEQRAYIDDSGRLIYADEESYRIARGVSQDDLILIFLKSQEEK